RVARAERQRIGHDAEVQMRRVVQFDDHVVEVFEDTERRDQTIVTATAGASQQVDVIGVEALNELVEVLLTNHQTLPLAGLRARVSKRGSRTSTFRAHISWGEYRVKCAARAGALRGYGCSTGAGNDIALFMLFRLKCQLG